MPLLSAYVDFPVAFRNSPLSAHSELDCTAIWAPFWVSLGNGRRAQCLLIVPRGATREMDPPQVRTLWARRLARWDFLDIDRPVGALLLNSLWHDFESHSCAMYRFFLDLPTHGGGKGKKEKKGLKPEAPI